MTICTLDQVLNLFLTNAKCAAIDLGTKTIGLAVCDKLGKFAHMRPPIKREKFTKDSQKLLAFFSEEDVKFAIMGLPVNMDGTAGSRVQATKAFVYNMEKLTDLPFIFWDERWSTVAAERQLIHMDVSRKKRQEKIDSMAACFILEAALGRLNQLKKQALPTP